MPYPQSQPDPLVFETRTDEYATVSSLGAPLSAPLTSSATLALLVRKGDFQSADTLRREMIAHNTHITRDVLYQKAARYAIRERRPHLRPKDRLEAFTAWMSLVPDRHEQVCSFYAIRQHIFRSMDHLNLDLVYHFGLVLAAKGYYCNVAVLQVVSTLARFAPSSVTEDYLSKLDIQCRRTITSSSTDGWSPENLMEAPFNMAMKKQAKARRTDASLRLLLMAHERGIPVSHETLQVILEHATDKHEVQEKIHTLYPGSSITPVSNISPPQRGSDDAGTTCEPGNLSFRLRALRRALITQPPPSPHTLLRFITDYRAVGRFRAIPLLRKLAFRHSFRSASTWVLTKMLYHRQRREPLHLLSVFANYFHLVEVPRQTILSLLRGEPGKSLRPRIRNFGFGAGAGHEVHMPPYPLKERFWPSPAHTALVWEALIRVSTPPMQEGLYSLLLQLVSQARHGSYQPRNKEDVSMHQERDISEQGQKPRMDLCSIAFDAAHFSPFIRVYATRGRSDRAVEIMADMVAHGIEPSTRQWGMLARCYSQFGNAPKALKILAELEKAERTRIAGNEAGQLDEAPDGCGGTSKQNRVSGVYRPSDELVGSCTNVLRGFILAGDVEHARKMEKHLVEGLGYQLGERPATDLAIGLLRSLELQNTNVNV